MAKVLYDFAGQRENELSIKAGDLIEIVQKETNGMLGLCAMIPFQRTRANSISGWWLAKNPQGQAWVPAAYVEEQAAPAPAPRAPPAPPSAKAKPPAPPAKRPAAGRKPADLGQRDSGMSLNGASGSDGSRSNTPTPSLGGSLADALLARKNAMQNREKDDDDW